MNSDLLPPTNTTPIDNKTVNLEPRPIVTQTPIQTTDKNNQQPTKPILSRLKNLPHSVYILIILATITLVLLISLVFVPKKGSKPANVISTDNIPEPQISLTSEETKQTPFYDEIIDFKKKSAELDYNYPTYNLPVIETKINLAK